MKLELWLPVATPSETCDGFCVSVSYDKGGPCYFNGVTKPRGYWVSVGPETRRNRMRGFALMSAPAWMLEPAKRRSDKHMAELFEAVKLDLAAKRGKVWETLQTLLSKHGLKLAEANLPTLA